MMNKADGGKSHRGNKGKVDEEVEREQGGEKARERNASRQSGETKRIQKRPWVRGLVYDISRLHASTL